MSRRRVLFSVCVALSAVFVAAAVVYITVKASSLPPFVPGHATGGRKHHTKYGFVLLALAAVTGFGVWWYSRTHYYARSS